ncbi:hypothetical protein DYB25_011300 [Aphanomyces astaci]|uniref:Uncharacterized protein n=1 Tax=Aphanomyces astaci TaxID=112090 RepID=A0A397ACZ5_APHAT|nr:hypothetical protein DYB25_011300 [Aphanomyces astaci]
MWPRSSDRLVSVGGVKVSKLNRRKLIEAFEKPSIVEVKVIRFSAVDAMTKSRLLDWKRIWEKDGDRQVTEVVLAHFRADTLRTSHEVALKDTPVSRLLGICDDMVVETINDVPYPEYLEVLKAWTGQPGQRTSDWMKKPSHVEAWTFKVHEYDCAAYTAISAGAHAHVHNDVVLELEDAIAKVKGTLQSNDEEIVR